MSLASSFDLEAFAPSPVKIKVEIEQNGPSLVLAYQLSDSFEGLYWPKPNSINMRKDGLWKNTAFELFLASKGQPDYIEWNFCPSGDWACYRFQSYRQLGQLPTVSPPIINQVANQDRVLRVELDWRQALPAGPHTEGLEFCVAAILTIKEERSFWSFAHPGAEPDFHDRRGFRKWPFEAGIITD